MHSDFFPSETSFLAREEIFHKKCSFNEGSKTWRFPKKWHHRSLCPWPLMKLSELFIFTMGFTSRVPQVPQAKSSSGHNYWGWGTNHHGDAKLRGSCPWEWTQGSILDTANPRNAGAGHLTCCTSLGSWRNGFRSHFQSRSVPGANSMCHIDISKWQVFWGVWKAATRMRLFDVLTLHMRSELRAQLLVSYYILQLGTRPFLPGHLFSLPRWCGLPSNHSQNWLMWK